jgi:N-acetylmuramoyl-L-alanine amidase
MRPLGVVLHLSASTYGDRDEIHAWHLQRGFSSIGYHRVILNGRVRSKSAYDARRDGELQKGRADAVQGAHCKAKGMNTCTFGICCVGDPGRLPAGPEPADAALTKKKYLTAKQSKTLVDLVARLCVQYGWDPQGHFVHPERKVLVEIITQHSDHDRAKPFCASLNLPAIRAAVAKRVREIREQPSFTASPAAPAFDEVERFTASPEGDDYEDLESDVPPEPAGAGVGERGE